MPRVRRTPDQATGNWVARIGQSTEQIQQGVNSVTEAPGQKAAAKSAKWLAAVTASQQKWARNVGAVTLDQWRAAMLGIGLQRVAAGAQAKQGKYLAFASEFFPHLERGLQKLEAMPDTSFEDRINKMITMARHNHEFKRGTIRAA